jgi:MoxR-like ATPase
MQETQQLEEQIQFFQRNLDKIKKSIAQKIVGHEENIHYILLGFFAGGHILLEGLPGLGKTEIVKTIRDSLHLSYNRIQFTPDLMPADIVGANVLVQGEGQSARIQFEKGSIFTNLVLADEINRANPRTQSALLQAMQEKQVTISGTTYDLPRPFCVIATQNPIEMEGTFPLPEAQLDRFFFQLKMDLPSLSEMMNIATQTTGILHSSEPLPIGMEEIEQMCALVPQVCINDDLVRYICKIVLATHDDSEFSLPSTKQYIRTGASPRGVQTLILGAKAQALSEGYAYVRQQDVQKLLIPALQHRILTNFYAEAENICTSNIIQEIADSIEC